MRDCAQISWVEGATYRSCNVQMDLARMLEDILFQPCRDELLVNLSSVEFTVRYEKSPEQRFT
jgi:hypothetical protein